MSEKKLVFDFSEVTCGLVPAMLAEMDKAEAEVIEFKIRQGIQTEILNGFGTGGEWELQLREGLGCDLARFTKKHQDQGGKLDILSF